MGRQGRSRKELLTDRKETKRIMETEGGGTRSHSVENTLLKGLWTCRQTDYKMNDE